MSLRGEATKELRKRRGKSDDEADDEGGMTEDGNEQRNRMKKHHTGDPGSASASESDKDWVKHVGDDIDMPDLTKMDLTSTAAGTSAVVLLFDVSLIFSGIAECIL